MTEENEWKFQQAFGDSKVGIEDAQEADIISAVEFDKTGDFLAIGDKGGRVVILQRNNNKTKAEYKVLTEFQSHEPEFDYLKSLEIEEKINQIRWLNQYQSSQLLLTTNDKTIKLWKIQSKTTKILTNMNGSQKNSKELVVPKIIKGENVIHHTTKKIFANAHAYHINSISLNSDTETFLSADDLRINLWNLSHPEQSFNIVDIKPGNMEDLTEVITCSAFHPKDCSTFLYSSSKGALKLGDLRQSASVSSFEKSYHVEDDPSTKTFFSEIIASISDAKFSGDGQYVLARDYMTLKVWDVRTEKRPLSILYVHEGIRSKLCDLYESDSIFDKFETDFSGGSKNIVTGSYKNNFHVFDISGSNHEIVEATRTSKKKKTSSGNKKDFEPSDFNKRCLHLSHHPTEDVISVAAINNLYIYAKNSDKVKDF
eukprot:gene785-9035_t